MKKILIIVCVLIVGYVAWYLGSPLFIDKKVSEDFPVVDTSSTATTTIESIVVASGKFSGFDRLHDGSGTATLIKSGESYVVRFEEDFNVTNGPDLFVGFGNNGEYIKGSEIAKLKGNVGSQNYELPKDFDSSKYSEVWIWCKQFSVPFAKAKFN